MLEKLSPQQIQLVKLLEIPSIEMNDRIMQEVDENPALELGENVDATGISKGKGFAGTIKRHNFKRHKKTHGGKGNTRKPGSIGSMYPQKIFKGKRMAGHMGAEQVTVKNLKVAYISVADNLIGVKGAVPGPKKGLIVIKGGAK